MTIPAPIRPMPRPELAGPRTQRVFDGVDSYFELQYAVVPGFRPLVLDLHVPAGSRLARSWCTRTGAGSSAAAGRWGRGRSCSKPAYAVASVDYRLAAEAQFPFPIHDLAASVRWVRANAQKVPARSGTGHRLRVERGRLPDERARPDRPRSPWPDRQPRPDARGLHRPGRGDRPLRSDRLLGHGHHRGLAPDQVPGVRAVEAPGGRRAREPVPLRPAPAVRHS